MREILEELLSSIYASSNEDGGMKVSSIWVSADESEAVSSALAPKLRQAERGVEELLFEVVTLQVSLYSHLHSIPFWVGAGEGRALQGCQERHLHRLTAKFVRTALLC